MQSIEVAKTYGGELVLAPRNRTLFTCEHSHIVHMPEAPSGRTYKLLSRAPGYGSARFYGFILAAEMRLAVIGRRVGACDCVRAWAMIGELKRAH